MSTAAPAIQKGQQQQTQQQDGKPAQGKEQYEDQQGMKMDERMHGTRVLQRHASDTRTR